MPPERPGYNRPWKMSTFHCCSDQMLSVLKVRLPFCSDPSLLLGRTRADQITNIAVAFPQK